MKQNGPENRRRDSRGPLTPRAAGAVVAQDADLQLRGDVGVQTNGNDALTERLDRLVELHTLALDFQTVLVEELHEVLRRDRPEELALLGGLAPLLVRERFDPVA